MNAFHIGNQCRFSHLKLDMRSNLGMKLITWVKAIKINCSLSINQSIKFFSFTEKRDNPPDTNASTAGFTKEVGV